MIQRLDMVVSPDATIKKALSVIDSAALKIALVVDRDNRLLGTLSDGDIRRGLLSGLSIESPVANLMNRNPVVATQTDDRRTLLALMRKRRLHQIPIVDSQGLLVGLETIDGLLEIKERDNTVVLMAGGLGSRLRPLTEDVPKPLLRVGDRPILETIIVNFIDCGFRKFFLAVNYHADQIRNYFGDGSKWGVEIDYLDEDKPLGTAGALSLLPARPQLPVFVMNGDVLTRLNLGNVMDFHIERGAAATLGVREYTNTVPFGVVNVEGGNVVGIVEKPQERILVSAGIYVLSPELIDDIPRGAYVDMPTLLQKTLDSRRRVCAYSISDWWIDIGRMEDFDRARNEYGIVFT